MAKKNFKQMWANKFNTKRPEEIPNKDLDNNNQTGYTMDTKVNIAEVVNSTGDTYPAYVMEIAKVLHEMQAAYSVQSAEIAKSVLLAQDSLGLSAGDLSNAMSAVINLKQSLNDNVGIIFNIVMKK